MSPETCRAILRRHSSPLAPRPTGVEPVLRTLPGVRAVLFDVYGTLLISASGEVGTASSEGRAGAAEDALAEVGVAATGRGDEVVARLHETIRRFHEASRRRGVEHPEVDVVEVWRQVTAELVPDRGEIDAERLAVEYEARVNPTWPMPGVAECLERLRGRGLPLGIVSNAQFFTPELFPALLGASPEELGFRPELSIYSYRYGHAKPGRRLFELAAAGLAGYGVEPGEALYVGNDMLNDVTVSQALGFRTAFFAGDERSYRPRADDPRTAGAAADLVVVDLLSLDACLDAPPSL